MPGVHVLTGVFWEKMYDFSFLLWNISVVGLGSPTKGRFVPDLAWLIWWTDTKNLHFLLFRLQQNMHNKVGSFTKIYMYKIYVRLKWVWLFCLILSRWYVTWQRCEKIHLQYSIFKKILPILTFYFETDRTAAVAKVLICEKMKVSLVLDQHLLKWKPQTTKFRVLNSDFVMNFLKNLGVNFGRNLIWKN